MSILTRSFEWCESSYVRVQRRNAFSARSQKFFRDISFRHWIIGSLFQGVTLFVVFFVFSYIYSRGHFDLLLKIVLAVGIVLSTSFSLAYNRWRVLNDKQ